MRHEKSKIYKLDLQKASSDGIFGKQSFLVWECAATATNYYPRTIREEEERQVRQQEQQQGNHGGNNGNHGGRGGQARSDCRKPC
jgi:hypothetical protein